MGREVEKDRSNGYEAIAGRFLSARNPRIGVATLREWCRSLPRGGSVLDFGCGPGVPVTQTLAAEGFVVAGVDASPTMVAAFRERFPEAAVACSPVEESDFFGRPFDGIVAVGLLFLLPADVQVVVLQKAARALRSGGRLLFTSPAEAITWRDVQTGLESRSLGREAYLGILTDAGLMPTGEASDEGDNHYYFALKP